MSKLLGWSETWRRDGTGTPSFYVLLVPIWTRHFTHSTWME